MSFDLSTVLRPVSAANGLPNAHYTDPAVHAEEREAVLCASWAGIGVAAQVPEPGDACPVELDGMPLLMMRGRDGKVRVFQNICRHRGVILVSEPRRIEGAIRCPYHSWCYAHDGRLVATPHVGGPGRNSHPGLDRDRLGLVEVPSHVWRDVVFVNISGTAPPFEEAHADLIERWKGFDAPLFHGGEDSRFTLEVAANWKLAVENYCEAYHLPWVHPGLNSYSRLEDHYNIEAPGLYSGQGTRAYRQLRGPKGETFPDFPNLALKWEDGAEYVALYPNVLFGAQRDHAYAIILRPLGMDRTREEIHIYYAAPEVDAALRAENARLWRQVFEEDVGVVEGMQRGRRAPGFDGGRFSPAMDGPTHCFHAWVAERLMSHRAARAAAE